MLRAFHVTLALQLAVALSAPSYAQRPFSPALAQETFQRAWEYVRDHYADPGYNGVDWSAVRATFEPRVRAAQTTEQFYALMAQMIASLGDDHSAFLPPVAAQLMQSQRVGAASPPIYGLAANLRRMPDRSLLVLQVMPGTQAELLFSFGDRITAINRMPLDVEDRTADLYGKMGEVQLTVHSPDGSTREVVASREAFTTAQFPSPVLARVLSSGAGYLALFDFLSFSTASEVRDALRRLLREHQPGGLILDLRANDGGIVVQALEVLSLFLDGGSAGAHVDRRGNATTYTIPSGRTLPEARVPIVILVGQNTNSAGELFAAVMQAHQRARILGVTTPGNVEMARDFRLPDGSMLWLAVGRYRDPLGRMLEGRGVLPDRVVPAEWWRFQLEKDPQVRAAVEELHAQGARLRPPLVRVEPTPLPLVPIFTETPLQPGQAQATFDAFWALLDAHHLDRSARRAEWKTLRARFLPRLSQVRHTAELDALMHELTQALGLSYASRDTASVLRDLERGRESQVATVGASMLVQEDGSARVVGLAAGSPATSAGLRIGDRVLHINGELLPQRSLWARYGMPGPEGWLALTVHNPEGLTRTIHLRRTSRAPLPSPISTQHVPETRSGQIAIAHFRAPNTAAYVRDAVFSLLRQGSLEHLVLDLRRSEGGQVIQALNVLALFVDGGNAGQLISESHPTVTLIVPRGRTLVADELVITVLISEEAHGMATIVAETLRTRRNARVLGEGTRVLSVAHDLPNGGRVWLPGQQYLPPS
ncbi:MAG: S41 family peptidase [Thermoflexales bacterium]|nr:S41 family peptidase [Thermoflexales bacterium]